MLPQAFHQEGGCAVWGDGAVLPCPGGPGIGVSAKLSYEGLSACPCTWPLLATIKAGEECELVAEMGGLSLWQLQLNLQRGETWGKRTTELIRRAELSECRRMAQRQQTKGMGWQSAGSMEKTASLGMIKQTEQGEGGGGGEQGGSEAGERQEGTTDPETVTCTAQTHSESHTPD